MAEASYFRQNPIQAAALIVAHIYANDQEVQPDDYDEFCNPNGRWRRSVAGEFNKIIERLLIIMNKRILIQKLEKTKVGLSILTVRRIWKYPQFRQWINDNASHSIFKFQEFGPYNVEKQIYIIGDQFDRNTSGFFACWKDTIEGIIVSERYGLTPVADWTKTPYSDEDGWQGLHNPFEWYFEPLSPITIEEARASKNVTFYNQHTCGDVVPLYGWDDDAIEKYARINAKYIHIKDKLLQKIRGEIDELLGNRKTLAVHIRGVEWGEINSHPIPATLDEYIKAIDAQISQNKYEQIFLATDSDDTMSLFLKKYGDIVACFSNAARALSGSKLLPIFCDDSDRKNNGYWLGYEVLRDMLALSSCDGLVAGYSHVSFAAQAFKRSRGEAYLSRDFVSQKICANGNNVGREILKLVEKEKKNARRRP